MNHENQTLGQLWLTAKTTLQTRRALLASIHDREAEAQTVAERLMRSVIPDAISSMVAGGQDCLTIELPQRFVGTRAFRSLEDWLGRQGLAFAITDVQPEGRSDWKPAISITAA